MAASGRINVAVSATEMPQYRRLVEFLAEVESYAQATADADLAERVEKCRAELEEMRT